VLTATVGTTITSLYPLLRVPSNSFVTFVALVATLFAALNWLREDARGRDLTRVADVGLFLYVAWPVVIPWYFLKTRGPHALPLAFVILILIATPVFVPAIIGIVRLFPSGAR
jgi:hypothetical protein